MDLGFGLNPSLFHLLWTRSSSIWDWDWSLVFPELLFLRLSQCPVPVYYYYNRDSEMILHDFWENENHGSELEGNSSPPLCSPLHIQLIRRRRTSKNYLLCVVHIVTGESDRDEAMQIRIWLTSSVLVLESLNSGELEDCTFFPSPITNRSRWVPLEDWNVDDMMQWRRQSRIPGGVKWAHMFYTWLFK